MNARTVRTLLFALSLIVAAASSFGQQEQWLRYRTAVDPYGAVGAGGYQNVTSTTTAPEGLKLPNLVSDKPLFFRWKSPAAKDGGMWCVLDRSGERLYDRLYVDPDGDGDLAKHPAIKAEEARDDGNFRSVAFRQVKLLLGGEEGPTAYHLNVLWQSSGGRTTTYFASAGWYEGPVTVGGKSLWCTLIDANANGRFDDRADGSANRDKIRIAAKGDRSFFSETDRVTRFVGKYVEVEDKLYTLEVAPDGASVKLSPAGDVASGSVRLTEGVSEVALLSKDGHFIRKPKDGLLSVPVGEYRVLGWQAGRTDKDGKAWQLLARNTSDGPVAVSVVAGKEAALDIAEPIQSRASLSRQGDEYVINQELRGRGGESVSLRCTGEQPPAPRVRVVNADRSYDGTYSMEYG